MQIDGHDISSVLMAGAPSPHDEILLFDNEDIVGIRTQRWKYVTEAHYHQLRFKLEDRGYVGLFDLWGVPEFFKRRARERLARQD